MIQTYSNVIFLNCLREFITRIRLIFYMETIINCRIKPLLCVAITLLFTITSFSVLATEAAYIIDENPHPSSADELKGPLSSSFLIKRLNDPFFPRIKEKLQNLSPFLRDTKLGLNFRTFDIDPDAATEIG